MGEIFSFLPMTFGKLLYFIYNYLAFHNYGLAIILFTIFVRLLILPLTIKQYRSSAKLQELQPQIQELQKRHKNDKEKLQQETLKLYQENKANPAGGCLPLLIQMPILFSLWYAVIRPMTYQLGYSAAEIQSKIDALKKAGGQMIAGYEQLSVVIHEKLLDMNFLGLNLGFKPTLDFGLMAREPMYIGLLLLPILAVVTTFISVKMSMPKTNQNANNQMAGAQNAMAYIAPLMTLYFSFIVPAALGLYWVTGYVIQIFQQLYINKYVMKKKEVAKS